MQFGRDSEALDELAEALPALLRLRNPWTNYYLISSFSEVYARGGEARRAVMPRGTSDAIAVWVGDATQPTPEEAQEWDLLAAEIRKSISAEQWDAEYRAGRATSVEDAVHDIQQTLAHKQRSPHYPARVTADHELRIPILQSITLVAA